MLFSSLEHVRSVRKPDRKKCKRLLDLQTYLRLLSVTAYHTDWYISGRRMTRDVTNHCQGATIVRELADSAKAMDWRFNGQRTPQTDEDPPKNGKCNRENSCSLADVQNTIFSIDTAHRNSSLSWHEKGRIKVILSRPKKSAFWLRRHHTRTKKRGDIDLLLFDYCHTNGRLAGFIWSYLSTLKTSQHTLLRVRTNRSSTLYKNSFVS